MEKKRFYEIDSLRGIAIILMILFHIFYDLKFLGVYEVESSLFWWISPRIIASLFIFLVGVSLTISYSRVRKWAEIRKLKKYVYRGLKIFSWGLLITLITWIFIGEGFVIFGILHLIGLSIILAYPLLEYRKLNLFLGFLVILFGFFLSSFRFDFSFLLWLGLIPKGLKTLDFFPIIPWFGLILIGIYFGNTFYPDGKRSFKMKELEGRIINFFCFLGRNSLLIYLLHQPILIFLIFFVV